MGKIMNVNKQLEELTISDLDSVSNIDGFVLNTFDKSFEIRHLPWDNTDIFDIFSVKVDSKKKLFKGYVLTLHISYSDYDGMHTIDVVLNPSEGIKLKSDLNEYIEWISDTITNAFYGEW